MKLSVIIVNYNVRHFLEQCLRSVERAAHTLEVEVFVVDNASLDGSAAMVREKFPSVKLIANEANPGFSKANNQAIAQATGEFVLLLNPDTVVVEDTFKKCIAFMHANSDAGALGVRMIDGKGNFLPESKRGLPTPWVAFYKTFGLAKLFPSSKIFGRYHLGFLSEHETNEVDVLSGAFMFMRKTVLDKTGLLDEAFFMYGEDVDLSYRIQKMGYKNFYFPQTTIIHYKGESTKKGSLNYVKVFYKAMLIFSQKHFSGNQSGLFSVLINLAILFRGLLTLFANLFASSYLFLVDALLSFMGICFIKTYWEDMIKYAEHYYPNEFLFIVVPLYIFIWILATFLSGGYDKPFRTTAILRGILFGTVAIAVLYAFIPNDWRFSRAIILLGAVWTGFEMLLTRTVYHVIKYQSFEEPTEEERRTLIVGQAEASRAERALRMIGYTQQLTITSQLAATQKQAAIHHCNEVIFCALDYTYQDIVAEIDLCGNAMHYKILNAGSDALIGSNSKDSAGDLYVAERSYSLFKPQQIRSKRVFDLAMCIILLALLPLNIFVINNFHHFTRNWFKVFLGDKSWVGLHILSSQPLFSKSKPGVLAPYESLMVFNLSEEEKAQAELYYARNYSVSLDIRLCYHHYTLLGQ